MPEIKVEITEIRAVETKSKIVENRADGMVTDRRLVTAIKFEAECRPDAMSKILWALKSGQKVSAIFVTPQLELGIEETEKEKEPARAG